MMTLYCDESDDGETYALAGWLGTPSGWDLFDPAWRTMLTTIAMPDGSPCPAFHATDIVSRDGIKGSAFRGWTFEDEKQAFSKAIDVVTDKHLCALMYPIGVAAQIPSSFEWIPRDSIWIMLFSKLFYLIGSRFPAQRSISFMFDEKKAIQSNALFIHATAKRLVNERIGEEYLGGIAFDDDVNVTPLQAADLFAYEWRKRISDERLHPHKAVRTSYARIREARGQAELWRYGRSLFEEAMTIDPVSGDQTAAYVRWFMEREPTHKD